MSLIGARRLFNKLLDNKVKYVFGYPGGAILPVLNEFYNQNKIKYVLSRTELGGSFMAEGYSKVTKTPGVVMVTSGPGAINITTSLQNALSDGTAILGLTGQVSTTVLGTDAFQEADVISITKPCTKWNLMIKDVNDIDKTIDYAFYKMHNKRFGPVLIDLPKNIMTNQMLESSQTPIINEKNTDIINEDNIDMIKKLLEKSERPVILAGQGVIQSDCIKELRLLSEIYNIPVTTTLLGLGVYNEKNILSLKMLGMHGSYYANKSIQNCDLLINFGCRFDDRIIGDPKKFAPKAKIIHIDVMEKHINRTIKSDYHIIGDCKVIINKLLTKIIDKEDTVYDNYNPYLNYDWIKQINEWKKNDFYYPTKKILQGREVIDKLNKIINDSSNNYTIVADVGAHQMWAAQFIDYNYPKVKFITSGGLGSMGFALPASIGVKLGKPNDVVICICGDGGFTMSFVEILTAVENKINVKILIINNNYQLMVKMWQEKFYNNQLIGVKMNNPSFEKVCKSLGCKSIKITKKGDVEKQLKYILNYNEGPIVANIITDDSETVLPMVAPGKSLDEMIIKEDSNKLNGDAPC